MVEYSYTRPIKNGRIQLAPFEWYPGLGGWAVSQVFMRGAGMGSRSLQLCALLDTLWMVVPQALERVKTCGLPQLSISNVQEAPGTHFPF